MSGVAMGTRYSHLTLEERCHLRGLMEMGLSVSEIARRLGHTIRQPPAPASLVDPAIDREARIHELAALADHRQHLVREP